MKHIKFSLINNDYEVQTETDFDVNENQHKVMEAFFSQIAEQLATGQEGHFEIEGLQQEPVVFTITSDELMTPGI